MDKDPSTINQALQIIFASGDPQQYKPMALQEFTCYNHASFKGVTGEQEPVDNPARTMGAFFVGYYHPVGKALPIEPADEIPEGLENSCQINLSVSIVQTNPKDQCIPYFLHLMYRKS